MLSSSGRSSKIPLGSHHADGDLPNIVTLHTLRVFAKLDVLKPIRGTGQYLLDCFSVVVYVRNSSGGAGLNMRHHRVIQPPCHISNII